MIVLLRLRYLYYFVDLIISTAFDLFFQPLQQKSPLQYLPRLIKFISIFSFISEVKLYMSIDTFLMNEKFHQLNSSVIHLSLLTGK